MTYLHCDHRRILLVDQNPTKRNLRATILRNYEIELHTASSIGDAVHYWTKHSYDLVLLAAQEDSDEAMAVSAQIREIHPRQRIGLLVGPPVFVQELGGKRKKAESIRGVLPSPAVLNLTEPVSSPHPSSPHPSSRQWQETVRRLVSDWYVDQSALFGLPS